MELLVKKLKERKLTVSAAESITGGLFASEIVAISGSSEVFKGSIVSYANDIKKHVLNIEESDIKQYGVVSKEVADAMATHVAKMMETDIAVSFTGNAGPNVLEDKEVGLVYSSLLFQEKLYSYKDVYQGDRNEIRSKAVKNMKTRLIDLLNKEGE